MALVAGPVQFVVAGLVTQAAWRNPYNWAANAVSDLGAVSAPLHAVCNASAIAMGVLVAAGVVLTGPFWGTGGMAWTSRILLVLSVAGMVLAGLKPEDVDLNPHVLGALFIFAGGSTGVLPAGFLRKGSQFGRLRALTLPLGCCAGRSCQVPLVAFVR